MSVQSVRAAPGFVAASDRVDRAGRAGGRGRVEVHLLSGFTLKVDAASVDLKPASQRLVGYLALLHRSVDRRHAALRLWPDKQEDRALANLRSALWRIRLLAVPVVDSTPTHLRLSDDVWVDTQAGVEELATVAHLDGTPLPGELLPDWQDDWIEIERERLRQHLLHVLERSAVDALREGRPGDAIDLGLRAIALEPLRESAHRMVIRAHIQEGNAHEARQHFRRTVRMLHDELGIQPSPELARLASDL